jgi:hypothetical protein
MIATCRTGLASAATFCADARSHAERATMALLVRADEAAQEP